MRVVKSDSHVIQMILRTEAGYRRRKTRTERKAEGAKGKEGTAPVDMPTDVTFKVTLQSFSDQFISLSLLALVAQDQSLHGQGLAMLWVLLQDLQPVLLSGAFLVKILTFQVLSLSKVLQITWHDIPLELVHL